MRQKQKEKRKSGFRRVMEGLGAFLGLLLSLAILWAVYISFLEIKTSP